MKCEDKIKWWIHTTIKEAYKLGYKEGMEHGLGLSTYIENVDQQDGIIRRDMDHEDLAKSIIKEIENKPAKKRKTK